MSNKDLYLTVDSSDVFHVRALCDDLLSSLCQAKALLQPINQEDFFRALNVEVLQHYFYAVSAIISDAQALNDSVCAIVDRLMQ